MDLSSDLRIAVSSVGDPPRLAVTLTPLKDGEPLTPPSEPIILVDGQTIMYGPIGIEYTVESTVSVYQPDQPVPPPAAPAAPAAKPAAPAARPGVVRPGR